MDQNPPKYALKLLSLFCKPDFLEEIEGDLTELFDKRKEVALKKAKRQFLWDVIKSFRWVNIRNININIQVMNEVKNYIKIYFRRFRKETIHYIVNILGLTMGLSVLFFVLMYVHDENTIDSFHSKADRIYRVTEHSNTPEEGPQSWSITSNPLFEALENDFPEIEASARMVYFGSSVLRNGDRAFSERNYVLTSPSIFDIMDFQVLSGNPKKSFQGQAAVVLTRSSSKKLYGDEDPVGSIIDMPNRFEKAEVIAVIEDMPKNSSFQFNALYVSHFKNFDPRFQDYFDSWDSRFFTTWVLLKPGANTEAILSKKKPFLEKYYSEELRAQHDFSFQKLSDIHLGSTHLETIGTEPPLIIPYSNGTFVSIILLIGLGVILIAALNYINLSSVQALKRTLEAGVRKVNGATMGNLRFQLLIETFLSLFIAYIASVILIFLLLPFFNDITSKALTIIDFFQIRMLSFQSGSVILIGFLSAIIPAFYYSKLNRSLVIEKNTFAGKGEWLRKVFITTQYGISMVLIVAVIVLYRQLNYIESKDLGFEKEQIITLDINSGPLRSMFKPIKQGILTHPSVSAVSASSRVPGEWKSIPTVSIFQNFGDNPMAATLYAADKDWLDTYNIEILQGQYFTGNDPVDSLKVILNEKAVSALGFDDPIGKSIYMTEGDTLLLKIAGVIKDFHFQSLYEPIGPVALINWNNNISGIDYYSIKYTGNTSEVIGHIQSVNDQYDASTPAELNFLNDRWERYYQADQSRSTLFFIAAIVSILISVIGLFGMINYTIERKTKEIGIRKVMGANRQHIITILTKDYLVLLGIAVVISFPLAFWWLDGWLSTFAYRISLSVDIFVLAVVMVLLISGLTVVFRILKAATVNPVRSLRYE